MTWEIFEQPDGSAVIHDDGIPIGTIHRDSIREEPVALSYSGEPEDRSYAMGHFRRYYTQGRSVGYQEFEGQYALGGITVLSTTIAGSGAATESTTDLDEASSHPMTYDEVRAWVAAKQAAEAESAGGS